MNKDVVYWTMRNGDKISIDSMDINHLRNALKMIVRNQKVQPKNLFQADKGGILENFKQDAIQEIEDEMEYDYDNCGYDYESYYGL